MQDQVNESIKKIYDGRTNVQEETSMGEPIEAMEENHSTNGGNLEGKLTIVIKVL